MAINVTISFVTWKTVSSVRSAALLALLPSLIVLSSFTCWSEVVDNVITRVVLDSIGRFSSYILLGSGVGAVKHEFLGCRRV